MKYFGAGVANYVYIFDFSTKLNQRIGVIYIPVAETA
jgi:hypothetical protein